MDCRVGADLGCAHIEYVPGMLNPLMISVPELLVVPFASAKALSPPPTFYLPKLSAKSPDIRRPPIDWANIS
jgi:hypothetical protein